MCRQARGVARMGRPGAGRTRGSVDDAALHAHESGGNGRRNPIVDGRECGVQDVEKFGDILDTQEVVE